MTFGLEPRPYSSSGRSSVAPVATMTTPWSTDVRLPSLSDDGAGEVADEAVEVGELGLEVDLDVGVVDQALLELLDERGGIVALDGLAELEHVAAELAGALDEVRLVAHVAEREGAGHARHAAADDDGGVGERHVHLEQRLEEPGAGHAHLDELLGLLRGLLRLLGVYPARLVADVGHLEEERVEARLTQGVLEDGLVRARRTAGHHDAVEVVLLDLLADERRGCRSEHVYSVSVANSTPGSWLAYSATLSTPMTPAMLLPQWHTNTPTRGSSPTTLRSAGYSLSTVSVPRESARPVMTWAAAAEACATLSGMSLGSPNGPHHEHALAARLERVELVQLAEAVAVERHAEPRPASPAPGREGRTPRRAPPGRSATLRNAPPSSSYLRAASCHSAHLLDRTTDASGRT